jgi:hypothetical protein
LGPPSAWETKPKPLSALNHITFPWHRRALPEPMLAYPNLNIASLGLGVATYTDNAVRHGRCRDDGGMTRGAARANFRRSDAPVLLVIEGSRLCQSLQVRGSGQACGRSWSRGMSVSQLGSGPVWVLRRGWVRCAHQGPLRRNGPA